MVRPEKVAVVKDIKQKIKKSDGIILTDFRGLNVDEISELRHRLRQQGVDYKVFKNTLLRIAAQQLNLEELMQYLVGPTALAFGYEDGVSAVKALADFSREYKALKIKAGVIDGEVMDAAKIKVLASLPSREGLLAMFIGSLEGPIAGFVQVIGSPVQALAGTLNAVAMQK